MKLIHLATGESAGGERGSRVVIGHPTPLQCNLKGRKRLVYTVLLKYYYHTTDRCGDTDRRS